MRDPGCTLMPSNTLGTEGSGKGVQDPDCTPTRSRSRRCKTKVQVIPNCPRVCRARGCRTRAAPLVPSQFRRCKVRTSGCRTRAASPCPPSPGAQHLERGCPFRPASPGAAGPGLRPLPSPSGPGCRIRAVTLLLLPRRSGGAGSGKEGAGTAVRSRAGQPAVAGAGQADTGAGVQPLAQPGREMQPPGK